MNQLLKGFWKAGDLINQLVVSNEEENDWLGVTITSPKNGINHCHYKIEADYFVVRYSDNTIQKYEILPGTTPLKFKIKTPEGIIAFTWVKA
jgi:hypothetical protein